MGQDKKKHDVRAVRGKMKGKFAKLKNVIKREKILAAVAQTKTEKLRNVDDNLVEDGAAESERRIVDITTLKNELWCSKCQLPLSLRNIKAEKQCGLAAVYTVICTQCHMDYFVHTNARSQDDTYEVNSRLALGMIDGGMGEIQVNTLLSNLNVPTIPSTTIKRYERKVGPVIEAVATESCLQSIRVEKDLTMKSHENEECV